jgi:hypothetical protein
MSESGNGNNPPDPTKVPFGGKMRELMSADVNNITDFVTVWEGIFTELLGVDYLQLCKRLVGEMQVTAPELYGSQLEAAAFCSKLGSLCLNGGASVTGLVHACYSELLMLTVRGLASPEDVLRLCSDWWHSHHTIPQKQYMAANGLTDEKLAQMQQEINDKTLNDPTLHQTLESGGFAKMSGKTMAQAQQKLEGLSAPKSQPFTMKVVKGGKSN